ncbi:hypothetical protein BV898_03721 [Hypsibius exemplaris]|uniref:Uncharacterized protein n=1 Tax=Hypsibius exemplaris TaxID=2072580 RepID=A0A1W0X3Z1_HYPEX|nr:hypothetical protein BV898_03721 [Hypsibius exemplaris]
MAEKTKVQVDFDEDVGGADFTKLTRDEDGEEDVKDNWDDESEEETDAAAVVASTDASATADTKPKKKSAKQLAAEKEALKKKEQEQIRLQLEQNSKPKSVEDILAEKRRLAKAIEDSDFAMGADTFLEPENDLSAGTGKLDSFEPTTVEKFDEFRKLLTEKLMKYEKSEFYPGFLNSLFQDLSLHLPAEDVRKFGATLTTLAGEKAKHEKEKAKGKAKVTLKKKAGIAGAGKKDDSMATYDDYGHDAVDDFF